MVSKRVFIGKDRVPGVIGAKLFTCSSLKSARLLSPGPAFHRYRCQVERRGREEGQNGDYAVFDTEFEELSPGIVKAKALDDRIGCALIFEILREEWENLRSMPCSLPKKRRLEGRQVAAYRVKPDMGIALRVPSAPTFRLPIKTPTRRR